MATAPVSLSEYLSTVYEPDADYVEGVIEERPAGEWDHASWQDALSTWFRTHGKEWNLRARTELRVQVGESTFRVPDVTVVERDLPKERIVTHPPVAVFEVLSPEDKITRVFRKLADYERMGIRTILVVDPETDRFYKYMNGNLARSRFSIEPIEGTNAIVDWQKVIDTLDD